MKKELDEKLCREFPDIFRDRYGKISETCMCWGIECGEGWYDIIHQACSEMKRVKQKSGINFYAEQIKEKYGTLRFYYTHDRRLLRISKKRFKRYVDYIDAVVSNAEKKSETICEHCGKKGKRRDDGWIRTLCNKCNKNRYNNK